jgi:hypothetical protein
MPFAFSPESVFAFAGILSTRAQTGVLHMDAPQSFSATSSRASVSPTASLCSALDSRRLASRRCVASSYPGGAPAVTAVDPRTQCALVCYVKSISCKPGRLACMAFSCKIVAKESTGFNRCPLQVIENTDLPQGGSTVPKAVSDPSGRRLVFNYLRFSEIRPTC